MTLSMPKATFLLGFTTYAADFVSRVLKSTSSITWNCMEIMMIF